MTNDNHQLFGKSGAPLYTSDQAAGRIGITRGALIVMVARHPELRPKIRINDYFWSEGEIETVALKKATSKRGRPAKK